MRLVTFAVAAALTLVPGRPQAQLDLGARIGYAASAGQMLRGANVATALDGFVPLQLDLGWAVGAGVTVGAYASIGLAVMSTSYGSACYEMGNAGCSGRQLRAGLQATWTLRRAGWAFAPWFGVGAGYEWVQLDFSPSGTTARDRWSGPELANLQLGVNVKRWNPTFGPFLMVSFGRFDDRRLTADGTVSGGAIGDRAIHRHVSFGLRGGFGG